ncbi:hypothetical protein OSTOST_04745 [Ostertagia ostertagi]
MNCPCPAEDVSYRSSEVTSRGRKKKQGTLVGYKPAGPDNRAFTLIAKNLQQPENRTETVDTLDVFKEKRDSDIAIRKSKMVSNVFSIKLII